MRSSAVLKAAILASLLVFCARSGAQRLTGIAAEPAAIGQNLIADSGFESSTPGGAPIGWLWDRRNTDSTCTIDPRAAHSGARSLHFTNGTPFGANVYGTLWLAHAIRLTPGKPYTVSAWVRSQKPGTAWIGGGSDWQFRLPFPPTDGQWRRVALTFTPGEADADFQPRIVTEAPTPGIWVDDVKLEAGGPTPVEPTEGTPATIQLSPESQLPEIEGDGPFAVGFSLLVPAGLVPDRIEARLGDLPAVSRPLNLSKGAWSIRLSGESRLASGRPVSLRVRLLRDGREVGRAESSVRFISAEGGERRLAALRSKLPELKHRVETRRAAGQDVSYPMVTYTVLANFVNYVQEDLTGGGGRAGPEIKRAIEQLDALEPMSARLDRELAQAKRLSIVPRWTGATRPKIVGPSFVGPTAADGRLVTRPIFFTGYGHFGQVRDDIEKFPGYGVNIIQIEVGPSAVLPTPESVDMAPIRDLLSVLARAGKAGVAVCLLISPHYMPGWALERYPDLRKRRDGFLQYCLHAPEGQAILKRFLGILIPAIKDSPALQSICLSNEPVNVEEPCNAGATLWRAWLRKRHGDVATVDRLWNTRYTSFDQIPEPNPYGPPMAGPVRADFIRWNQEFFAGWHRMLADTVHKYAPNLPVHAKAMTWTLLNAGDVRYGVDAGLFAGFSQINGNDSVNFPTAPGSEFAQGWELNAMGHDLQRSVLDAPVFNTENHLIPDRFTGHVSADHIRAALWQAAVHGQSATTIWVWERTFDRKSDFAGSIMHRPECAEAVGIVNCDLNRAAPEMAALQRARPDVWILQSVSAATWDGDRYGDCLGKLYEALDLNGLKVGFVTERQLESGLSLAGRTVFVPNIVHLSGAAVRQLRTASSLWLVGGTDQLSRDEYDQPRVQRIAGVVVPFAYPGSTARELWRWVSAHRPSGTGALRVVSAEGPAETPWGIEYRYARYKSGHVVNLCNYRSEPVTIRFLGPDGRSLAGLYDVLTGARVSGPIALAPLQVRLLRSP